MTTGLIDYDVHKADECKDPNIPPECITHKTTVEIIAPIVVKYKNNELIISGKRCIVPPGGLCCVDADLQ